MKPPLPRLLAITAISLLAITGCAIHTDQPYEVPEPQQTVSKEAFGNNNVSGSIGTGTEEEDFGSSNVSGGIGITEDNSRFNLTEPPVDIPPMEGSVPEGWTPR